MKIYLDSDYRCHVFNNEGNMREMDVPQFDGKCQTYIEGYRYVPSGETWTMANGKMLSGDVLTPWKTWQELDAAQRAYEQEQLESLSTQNAELLDAMAAMVEDVYNQDVSEIGGE